MRHPGTAGARRRPFGERNAQSLRRRTVAPAREQRVDVVNGGHHEPAAGRGDRSVPCAGCYVQHRVARPQPCRLDQPFGDHLERGRRRRAAATDQQGPLTRREPIDLIDGDGHLGHHQLRPIGPLTASQGGVAR